MSLSIQVPNLSVNSWIFCWHNSFPTLKTCQNLSSTSFVLHFFVFLPVRKKPVLSETHVFFPGHSYRYRHPSRGHIYESMRACLSESWRNSERQTQTHLDAPGLPSSRFADFGPFQPWTASSRLDLQHKFSKRKKNTCKKKWFKVQWLEKKTPCILLVHHL